MAVINKGAASDINSSLKRIMRKAEQANWDSVTATLSAPVSALTTELGPLTSEARKASTVDAAVMLACTVGARDQKFVNMVSNLGASIAGSRTTAGIAGADSTLTLSFNIESFRAGVAEQVQSVKSSAVTTEPLLVQLLDVLILQSVAAVPVVGPVLSGVLGGVGSGLAAGITVGGNVLAAQFSKVDSTSNPTKATGAVSNWQGFGNAAVTNVTKGAATAISKSATAPDFGEDGWTGDISGAGSKASGPVSFIYYLSNARSARSEKERLAKLSSQDEASIRQSMGNIYIQNPLEQHQAANNARQLNLRAGKADSIPVSTAGKELKDKLVSEDKTLTGFFNNIPDIFDKYREFILTVAGESVLDSFDGMADTFDDRLAEMRMRGRGAVSLPNWLKTPATRERNTVALLIIGYYFNEALKSSPALQNTYASNIRVYYRNPGDAFFVHDPATFGPAPKPLFQGVTQNKTSSAIINTFHDTLTAQASIDEDAVQWSQIKTKSQIYVGLVKNALINEMAQSFSRSLDNRKGLSEMIKLTLASSLIVNQVMVALSAKKGISLDDRYVKMISDLGFVNLYRKIGSYNNADKLKLTGTGEAAKLRYPMASKLSRSASTAERTMVYLFACCVLAYVDIGRVVMGYQDWNKTKKQLHILIDEINKSEKD